MTNLLSTGLHVQLWYSISTASFLVFCINKIKQNIFLHYVLNYKMREIICFFFGTVL